jgi:hypothetical protein
MTRSSTGEKPDGTDEQNVDEEEQEYEEIGSEKERVNEQLDE